MLNIRAVTVRDIDALYAISLATGLAGGDAAHLYRDGWMMGHIYSAPYATLRPELGLVAEDDDGVAGFVVGVRDTEAWEALLERDWWPSLRRRYAAPDPAGIAEWTPDQRRMAMIHKPTPTPAAIAATYPAHLHMNLLPRLQRRGIGLRLFDSWLAIADPHGTLAMHVGVNAANTRALRFWTDRGFVELDAEDEAAARTR